MTITDETRDLPLIRDQLFVLAHDEHRGFEPRLHLPALGIGLAGAVLIDLLIAGRITVKGGQVTGDRFERTGTGDVINDAVLTHIRQTPRATCPLTALLRDVSSDVYDRTLGVFVASGVLTTERRRFRSRYVLQRPWLPTRVRSKVRYRAEGTSGPEQDADALCALAWALRLQEGIFFESRGATEAALYQVTVDIPVFARHRRQADRPHPDGSRRFSDQPMPFAAVPVIAHAVRDQIGDMATAALD
jgi:hypothetical protein